MKKLPKYFVIKRDEGNPLWQKYIDWINKTSDECLWINIFDNLSNFKNNPTLITLEEWDECVNGVKQEEPQGYFTYQNWTL